MVDSKKVFDEFRLRSLSELGGKSRQAQHYVAWSNREYESSEKRNGRSKRKPLLPKRAVDKVSPEQNIVGGQEGGNGSHDLFNGSSHNSVHKSDERGDTDRIFSPEFRKILENPIKEHHISWHKLDTTAKINCSLYHVLQLGGIVIIDDIPTIPPQYDNDEVSYYGIDTEDNSFGMPHFYQFATRDNVMITANWPIMMTWLSRQAPFNLSKKGHVCWGTNIEYELGNIFKHWPATPETVDVRWNKGRLTKYDLFYNQNKNCDWFQKGDKKVHLKVWDTLNHWPRSVKELGKTLSDTLKFDFAKLKFDPYGFQYAAMDAIISRSYAAVQRSYYNDKGIKLFFTAGATALNTYQNGADNQGRKFCNHRLYNSHEESELRWLIGALHGGRTEVFSLKEYNKELVGYFDINSAYPYAMKHGVFPNIHSHRWVKGHKDIERIICAPVEGIAEVEVDATHLKGFISEIPYLGTLEKENNRFVFPLGKWRDKYTFYELRRAFQMGYRFKYIEACYYNRCDRSPFEGYVDFCYAIRDEGTARGDKMLRDIGKSLGNNLFGKFGQRMRTSVLVPLEECDTETALHAVVIDGSAVVDVDEGFAKHTNVVWSAYITAMCRTLLYEHMLAAHANGNEILYCDTDSIFITGGKWPDSHQTRLGALKHEGDLSYFRAYLPKVYTYEMGGKREYKAKGVPFAQRERFMMVGTAEYKKPMKIREALRRTAIVTEQPVELGVPAINAWISVEKQMGGNYTKRKKNEDGSTTPLVMELEK
jgi:hypothetical protein